MAPLILDSFFVLIVAIAGRLTDDQQKLIDYLMAENRVLKALWCAFVGGTCTRLSMGR